LRNTGLVEDNAEYEEMNCSSSRILSPVEVTSDNQARFLKETFDFEAKLQQMKLSHCIMCRQFRLEMQTINNVCSRCNSHKKKPMFSHENKALPTWTKNDKVMYELPQELSHLTIAEKVLIQRVSPLVPVIHIKNCILGVRGHIVSFFQDISGIAKALPRLPSEVSMVKVIRDSKTRCGNQIKKAFTVDKRRVLSALVWLKKHNILYKDIDIDESRLSWMKNQKQCVLQYIITLDSDSESAEVPTDRLAYHYTVITCLFSFYMQLRYIFTIAEFLPYHNTENHPKSRRILNTSDVLTMSTTWTLMVMARKGGLFEILGLPYVGLYQNFRLTKREFFPQFSRKIHR